MGVEAFLMSDSTYLEITVCTEKSDPGQCQIYAQIKEENCFCDTDSREGVFQGFSHFWLFSGLAADGFRGCAGHCLRFLAQG